MCYCSILALSMLLPTGVESSFLSSASSSSSFVSHQSNNQLFCEKGDRIDFSFKRLQVDPPQNAKEMEPNDVAETIEKLLRGQGEEASQEAFIGSMDAWMVAFNKAKRGKERAVMYGSKLEGVLTLMEKNARDGSTVDAYATVMHLYLSEKEPFRALRVLGRMEKQLLTQEEGGNIEGFIDVKGRLIQYNRVLQGLASSSESSSLQVAFHLLMSMCLQERFTCPDVVPFAPTNVKPDSKSFATVLSAMLAENDGSETDILSLIKQAKNFDQLSGFLMKKMERAIGGDKERLDLLIQRSSSL